MNTLDALSFVGTRPLEEVLRIAFECHKNALQEKALEKTFQVGMRLDFGGFISGHILGMSKNNQHDSVITVMTTQDSLHTFSVEYLRVSSIRSLSIDNFQSAIHHFAENPLPEGLGEVPTILALKRKTQTITEEINSLLKSQLELRIDWTKVTPDESSTVWAIDGVLDVVKKFITINSTDKEFSSSFAEKVKAIEINHGESNELNLAANIFKIQLNFKQGLGALPKTDKITQYLETKL